MHTDSYGRRLFPSEASAFRAQKSAALNLGIFTGVIAQGDRFSLLHDPLAIDSSHEYR